MFRVIFIFIIFSSTQSVTIEHPSSKFIEQRARKDIDPILQHYVIPNEIQFQTNAIDNGLPYFLKCKGSKKSIKFTIPPTATKYLSLDTNPRTNTITATLLRNQLTSDLVGRYTCSETNNNNKLQEKSVYVYIQDGHSVFTKKSYPTVYRGTGIHFFNIPCQTTNWYTRMTCPSTDSRQCTKRRCTSAEKQANELKCNIQECPGQELCIPVYYTPSNFKPEKVLFDPQIGFALEMDSQLVPNGITQFTCMSDYTPSQQSRVPLDSSKSGDLLIHQPSLTVLSDESLILTCEIQYGLKFGTKDPDVFWFEDIQKLQLKLNKTDERVIDKQKQIRSKNSTIKLEGFQPDKIYRFYCVRVSEEGIYSGSIDITGASAPVLDLDIIPRNDSNDKIQYGSDVVYDITIFTIPRSPITLDLSRNGKSLNDDKRFEILKTTDRGEQYFEYTLTVYNITFEDEADLKINARSSRLEKSSVIKLAIKGNPVGEISFIPEQIPRTIPWRNENSKNKINLYSYGIFPQEIYRIVCTIRHHSDQKSPLDVYVQYSTCPIESCLSNLQSKTCQTSSNEQVLPTKSTRINPSETQYVTVGSHKLDDPSIGHQYLCCYRNQGSNTIAKAITVLSNHRNMFDVKKPEFTLVTGNMLTYRCEAHELVYDDIQIIYNDNSNTYERNSLDNQWRLKDSRQMRQPIDIQWNLPASDKIRSTAIEVKTSKLDMTGNNRYLQCIAFSKRTDLSPNANDLYTIIVDDPIPLKFQNDMPTESRLNKKSGEDVEFDCRFNGRPKPKISWFKGKIPLDNSNNALQFGKDNERVFITRAQASETGYYTCELNNGFHVPLRRSFDLRVKGTNPYSRLNRITAIIVIISVLLFLIMLILLIVFASKFLRMKKQVHEGVFYQNQGDGVEDKTKSAMSQVTRMALPDNVASPNVIRTFLSYLNGDTLPANPEDFKELGRGQFGVVYQVRLPDVGLVAAKALPERIRNRRRRRDKRKKSVDIDENQEMLSKEENQMKKAAEMFIDEIKIMYKAGKHVNVIGLRSVAYPAAKFQFVFTGGLIHDEDSFYLMELCSNGSLESMLKRFIHQSQNKPSLYQTLFKQNDSGMTVAEAFDQLPYQVACGVDYLNRTQIVHSDIAARNVLVTSRFIMKICDFGLATSTSYKNYREQLAQSGAVHLEKTTTEIATHNLTPELARALLNASTANERSLLNTCSMKSDAWSFGIFLWTLFLKCRIRPFDNLLEETKRNGSGGGNFFNSLARVISDGNVLRYIDYHSEIPRNIYGIIRECLVEENARPQMTSIRAYLCHSDMLSKQAFEYYVSEYNRYEEENTTQGNIVRFAEAQGVRNLPTFDSEYVTNTSNSLHDNNDVTVRPTTNDNLYYPEPYNDSYLTAKKKDSNLPQVDIKKPTVPPRNSRRGDDSYL